MKRKEARGRYKSNPAFDGRKERDGFVCGNPTQGVLWCVAVKRDRKGVHLRDTKDPNDTTLSFTKGEWKAFVKAVKDGEFEV